MTLSREEVEAMMADPSCMSGFEDLFETMFSTFVEGRGRGRSAKTLHLVRISREILEEIQPATVRAVCYKLFSLGLLANMGKNETGKVSRILTEAREREEIPWQWIVDGTRHVEKRPAWADMIAFGETVAASYRKAWWNDQPVRVEVWSEKETVAGVLRQTLWEYQVPFRNMRGLSSATVVHEVAEGTCDDEQPLVALYVGDWDPSGLYMSEEDLPTRLEDYGADESLDIERLSLTLADTLVLGDQVSFQAETKTKDARYHWFVSQYGRTCWELDAMDPNTLRSKVEGAIIARIDQAAWNRAKAVEEVERKSIQDVVKRWPKSISRLVSKYSATP
jgi:hypothetical protein